MTKFLSSHEKQIDAKGRVSVPAAYRAELEKRFAAARHIADSFPGFEGFELWRPLDEGGDYFVVTRWVDEASHDAYAAARRERDPNTVVSHADGTMSFEKVEFSE